MRWSLINDRSQCVGLFFLSFCSVGLGGDLPFNLDADLSLAVTGFVLLFA